MNSPPNTNAQLRVLIKSLLSPLEEGRTCNVTLAQRLLELLSTTRLVNFGAFGDLLFYIHVSNFQFEKKHVDSFVGALLKIYCNVESAENRIHILSLLRDQRSADEAGKMYVDLLTRQRSLGRPTGELVWELHHFVRRGEGTQRMREEITRELERTN